MRARWHWLLTVNLAICLVGLPAAHQARGEDTLPATAPAAIGPDDLGRLIEQLGAPEFSERQEASRKLSEAGRAVFPQLEQAAEAGSREVASRSVEILRRHFQGGDDATKQAARNSLERLAKGGNPAAAQRATDALNPPQEQTIPGGVNGINGINNINPALLPLIQRQGIQIQVGGLAPNVIRRTSVRTINGKREIEVQDGDKVTKVKDGANGGIEAEITEKVNGKETTRKVEAKDLDELKKKDADAAQIYERESARAAALPFPALPAAARAVRDRPPGIPTDTYKRQIESINRSIETQKARLPNSPSAQRTIDTLQRIKEQYEQRLKDAEKAGGGAAPAVPAGQAPPGQAPLEAAKQAAESAAKQLAEAQQKAIDAARQAIEAAQKAAEEARNPLAP